ncbi:MAG TPA: SDR family NAD(P)-dependent oxidoreductase [Solirubrobacterales bacterium]|nr:SDR family NAD(P)-dependent oxidoreductase [Solirubrobacterales bacterium]
MASIGGKGIVVTGASSGIGEAASRLLSAQGGRLVVVARREGRLRALADEIESAGHPRPAVIAADLGERGNATDVAEQARELLGEIDVLVNNAGSSIQGLSWVVGERDEARSIFETNLWSPLAMVAAIAPRMVARGEGVIVNTGSMARVSPFPHLGHYAASRAGLASITQTMHLELEPRGVRVVEVALGAIDTAGSTENRVLRGGSQWLEGRPGLGSLEGAARTLVAAVEGPAAGVVFYPRVLRWVHALPGLGRRHATNAAKGTDLSDTSVRVGGSAGAEEIREAREAWERRRPGSAS